MSGFFGFWKRPAIPVSACGCAGASRSVAALGGGSSEPDPSLCPLAVSLRVQSLGPLGSLCPWWPFRAPTRAGPVSAENISLGPRNCLPLFLKRVLVICRRNGAGGPGTLALNFVGDCMGLACFPGPPLKCTCVQEREGVVTVTQQSRGGAFSSLRKKSNSQPVKLEVPGFPVWPAG